MGPGRFGRGPEGQEEGETMMRKTPILVLAFWLGGIVSAFAQQEQWTGNVNVFVGTKSLDENAWAPRLRM